MHYAEGLIILFHFHPLCPSNTAISSLFLSPCSTSDGELHLSPQGQAQAMWLMKMHRPDSHAKNSRHVREHTHTQFGEPFPQVPCGRPRERRGLVRGDGDATQWQTGAQGQKTAAQTLALPIRQVKWKSFAREVRLEFACHLGLFHTSVWPLCKIKLWIVIEEHVNKKKKQFRFEVSERLSLSSVIADLWTTVKIFFFSKASSVHFVKYWVSIYFIKFL